MALPANRCHKRVTCGEELLIYLLQMKLDAYASAYKEFRTLIFRRLYGLEEDTLGQG